MTGSEESKSAPVSAVSEMVQEFYRLVGREIRFKPTVDIPHQEVTQIRQLLLEEMAELTSAMKRNNLVDIADGLGDVVYVLYGAALQYGINLDRVLVAVHQANMSKPNSDGSILRSQGGKILRGDAYNPPAIERALSDKPETGS